MGLMAHLVFPLLLGSATALLSPIAFLKRPHEWLAMVGRCGITFSAAPNFAYELCTRRVTDDQLAGLDLSAWRVAINGSEPVQAAVLSAFADRFAPAGFGPGVLAPSYGMAEATVFVSGTGGRRPVVKRVDPAALERHEIRPAGDLPARELVSCGAPADGFEIRIVAPETLEVVPEGRIGEIWLRGESMFTGYWRAAAATAEVCTESGFLRTGDLGMLCEGELYVTGRIADTMLIRGRNIYPHDVEQELRRHHAELRSRVGAIFAIPGEGTDELVVTHEVRRGSPDLSDLAGAIRETVVREFGVSPAGVMLLAPGGVRRTTSGKIERAAMRTLFLAGRLDALHDDSAVRP
jgi:acyl-CoA synthetase (AMP-forming)/AMP-acid ligase II